uniref:uncharacterized protein isoform X3 n=1 Tax=Myxine glutinosa TaxID=7769 RepID=UPI00358DFDCE
MLLQKKMMESKRKSRWRDFHALLLFWTCYQVTFTESADHREPTDMEIEHKCGFSLRRISECRYQGCMKASTVCATSLDNLVACQYDVCLRSKLECDKPVLDRLSPVAAECEQVSHAKVDTDCLKKHQNDDNAIVDCKATGYWRMKFSCNKKAWRNNVTLQARTLLDKFFIEKELVDCAKKSCYEKMSDCLRGYYRQAAESSGMYNDFDIENCTYISRSYPESCDEHNCTEQINHCQTMLNPSVSGKIIGGTVGTLSTIGVPASLLFAFKKKRKLSVYSLTGTQASQESPSTSAPLTSQTSAAVPPPVHSPSQVLGPTHTAAPDPTQSRMSASTAAHVPANAEMQVPTAPSFGNPIANPSMDTIPTPRHIPAAYPATNEVSMSSSSPPHINAAASATGQGPVGPHIQDAPYITFPGSQSSHYEMTGPMTHPHLAITSAPPFARYLTNSLALVAPSHSASISMQALSPLHSPLVPSSQPYLIITSLSPTNLELATRLASLFQACPATDAALRASPEQDGQDHRPSSGSSTYASNPSCSTDL